MSETPATENTKLDPQSEALFRAGVHFGYARTRRHPRMRNFIAGVKSNIEIFHIEKVRDNLDTALSFIETIGSKNGSILWVGTKPAASGFIKETALALGHPYVDIRWLGGTLTNHKVIRERIDHWQDLVAKKKSGELSKYTKQEQLRIAKEVERLTKSFEGILTLTSMPNAMFIVDAGEEDIALCESKTKKIPTIALINSDCDPAGVDYAIPGNDNASRSIQYVLEQARESYLKGKASFREEETNTKHATD
jgi:small subunit ribosomal protein S2